MIFCTKLKQVYLRRIFKTSKTDPLSATLQTLCKSPSHACFGRLAENWGGSLNVNKRNYCRRFMAGCCPAPRRTGSQHCSIFSVHAFCAAKRSACHCTTAVSAQYTYLPIRTDGGKVPCFTIFSRVRSEIFNCSHKATLVNNACTPFADVGFDINLTP